MSGSPHQHGNSSNSVAYIYRGGNTGALLDTIERIRPHAVAALIDSATQLEFVVPEAAPGASGLDPEATVHLFGPQVELCWRWDGRFWHARLILDRDAPEEAVPVSEFELYPEELKREEKSERFFLWGERRKNEQVRDDRLPRPLVYPGIGDEASGAELMAYAYRLGDEAVPTLLRYVQIRPSFPPLPGELAAREREEAL